MTGRHGLALAGAVAALGAWLVLMGAVLATAPPPAAGRAFALFPPRLDDPVHAILAAGAVPIGRAGLLWEVELGPAGGAALKRTGALAVLGGIPFASGFGCSGSGDRARPPSSLVRT
ncbi:MAG TPA: hypothetical protein VM434_14875 [Beijerinckiaceae bacterium]|nr:hypothetical protein [Beijerinckiaceae bacterium]